jgi:signal peptidase I
VTPRPSSRRVVAVVLSLVLPGAGHVVLGRGRRAAIPVALLLALLVSIPWTGALGLLGALVALVGVALDALVIRPSVERPAGLRVALILGALILGLAGFRTALRAWWLDSYRVPAASMAPTMWPGDLFLVAKTRRDPAPGDVIVFRAPIDPGPIFVKRVVGVAGDRIEVRGGALRVNGAAIPATAAAPCGFPDLDADAATWIEVPARCADETLGAARYAVAHDPAGSRHDFPDEGAPPYVVPPGTVFVLGDNRDNSADSRVWGPVPLDRVLGTALFVWWSSGEGGVRTERLGRAIR